MWAVPINKGGNDTIGSTTAGVSGPSVGCIFAIVCNPAASAGAITVTWSDATSSAGGIEVAVGSSSQLIPCANLNQLKFWSGSGTITVNAMSFR